MLHLLVICALALSHPVWAKIAEPDPQFYCIESKNDYNAASRGKKGDLRRVFEGDEMRLQCNDGFLLQIINAKFHEKDAAYFIERCETWNAMRIVYSRCDKKRRCSIIANSGTFGDICMKDVKRVLEVEYTCERSVNEIVIKSRDDGIIEGVECNPGSVIVLSEVRNLRDATGMYLYNDLEVMSALCDNRQSCTHEFKKPKPNIYELRYQCLRDDLKTTTVCEGYVTTINCGNAEIRIVRAEYGRTHPWICSNSAIVTDSPCTSTNVMHLIKRGCNGMSKCNLPNPVLNSPFPDHCPAYSKYLEVEYFCTKSYPPSQPKIPEIKNTEPFAVTLTVSDSTEYTLSMKKAGEGDWLTAPSKKSFWDAKSSLTVSQLLPGTDYFVRQQVKFSKTNDQCLPFTVFTTQPAPLKND